MSRTLHPRKRRAKQWGIWCEAPASEGDLRERMWLRGPHGREEFRTKAEAVKSIRETPCGTPGWTYKPRRLS